MKTMKNTITLSILALLLTVLGSNISFAGKPTDGGGGKKVNVESAFPNSVVQTQEEDVTILGSGFDNGSTVKFLVTGTTDDSQIEVGPAQFISSTELKVHVKTTGSTATVDYDIEVQATSGRKGKGTTLFKVQQAEITNSCSDYTSDFPAFAYTVTKRTRKGVSGTDVYLSNADGDCSILVHTTNYTFNIWLKYKQIGNSGIIAWSQAKDENAGRRDPDIDRIKMLRFNLYGKEIISALPLSSTDVYVNTFPGNTSFNGVSISPDGTKIIYAAEEVLGSDFINSLNELNINGCSSNCANNRIFTSIDSFVDFISYNFAGDRVYFIHGIYDLYAPGVGGSTVSFIEYTDGTWTTPRIVLADNAIRYDPNNGADVSFSDVSVANVDLEDDGSFEEAVSFRVDNSALNLSTTEVVDTTNCSATGAGPCLQSGESFIILDGIPGYHGDLTNSESLLCSLNGNISEYDLVSGGFRTVINDADKADAPN